MPERSAIRVDVAVIGGGLHGLSAALQIARRGRSVVVLEREFVGRHASGASAAGVRTLGRHAEDLDLSLEASRLWHGIEALVGDGCGFHARGQLRVAETAAELAALEAKVARLERLGYGHEVIVGPNEIAAIVPALRRDVKGGIFVAGDGAADPHRTLRAFRLAAARAGARIAENEGVEAIAPAAGGWRVATRALDVSARAVVNAAGAWAGEVAAMVGDRFEVAAKASMMIVTEPLRHFCDPVVSAVGRTLSFKQTDRGTLVLGGGLQGRALLERGTTEPDMRLLADGARAAVALFPSIGNVRINRVWSGLEAKTPDMLPVIDLSPAAANVVHVFGFSGHGFQLVPAAGLAVADLVIDGRTARAVGGLRADRFAARRVA